MLNGLSLEITNPFSHFWKTFPKMRKLYTIVILLLQVFETKLLNRTISYQLIEFFFDRHYKWKGGAEMGLFSSFKRWVLLEMGYEDLLRSTSSVDYCVVPLFILPSQTINT